MDERLSEDEYDAMIVEQAYNEYLESGKQSRPIAELWKELESGEKLK